MIRGPTLRGVAILALLIAAAGLAAKAWRAHHGPQAAAHAPLDRRTR